MAKYVPKVFEDILQRMIDRVVARSSLSDLNDASIFKHVLAATAREADDIYHTVDNKLSVFSVDQASDEDLDERVKDANPDAITRKVAVAATGVLVFSRTTTNPGPDIPIAIGTQVEVPGEDPPIIAITTAAGAILTGNTDSANVAAIVADAGSRGNAPAGFLTKFKGAKPSNVDSVTNPSAFTNGLDRESDDTLRQRFKDYTRSLARCTPSALEFIATETEDPATGGRVVFARVTESINPFGLVILYIDDGTGAVETTGTPIVAENLTEGAEFPGDVAQGGETELFTNEKPIKDEITPNVVRNPGAVTLVRDDPGADGYVLNPAAGQLILNTPLTAGDDVAMDYTPFTGLIQLVQKVIDGDPADRTTYPGHRAAGVLVKVRAPTTVNVLVTVNITVRDGFVQADAADGVRTAISSYVNALGIGNDVVVSEIIERAMAVDGMFDIQVTQPAANIAVLEDQLPRINDAANDVTII